MLFQVADRVVYKKNPLIEVVCQLRFPKILKIDKEIPSDFQEFIRDEFPILNVQELRNIEVNFNDGGTVEKSEQVQKMYNFSSDEQSTRFITLTSDFIAVTFKKYDNWGDFRAILVKVSEKLNELYRPSFFNRMGLRYKNIVERENLGLHGRPWGELINSQLVGVLEAEGSKDIKHYIGQFLMPLDGGLGTLNAQYGLILSPETNNMVFLIDGDFFIEFNEENGSLDNAINRADAIKPIAHSFFRWSIRDPLHIAMEPQKENN